MSARRVQEGYPDPVLSPPTMSPWRVRDTFSNNPWLARTGRRKQVDRALATLALGALLGAAISMIVLIVRTLV